MGDDRGRSAAIINQTGLRDIFAGRCLILASQNVVIAKDVERTVSGKQRSERAAAAESTGDVLNIASRNSIICVAALVWISSLREQRREDESSRED